MISAYEMYLDINKHLMNDEKPSIYLNSIFNSESFKQKPFDILKKLKYTEQSKKYHPEGNVWNHTMLVIDEAAKRKLMSNNPCVFMWAALLHDLGKPAATRRKNGRVTSYNHDKLGSRLTVQFLSHFTEDTEFIKKVSALVRWHMQILFVVKGTTFSQIAEMKKEIDLKEIALLGFCDRLGRDNSDINTEKENIELFLKKCNKFVI